MESLIAALPEGLLPPGRLVAAHDGGPARYWLSDGPAPAGLWPRLRAEHAASGLWPLLLGGLAGDETRPWAAAEVLPAAMSSPADHDAAIVLAGWWAEYAATTGAAATEPFTAEWPGPADPIRAELDPDACADALAEQLVGEGFRLGLAAAARGADALTVTGWSGAANFTDDTGRISAVLRSWEDRFGARLVAVGFDTVRLSVAAAPPSPVQALRVAAEHAAFCPDLIVAGAGSLTAYATAITGAATWHFRWA